MRELALSAMFTVSIMRGQIDRSGETSALGGVDKLAMLGEQVSLRLVDRAAIPIDFTL